MRTFVAGIVFLVIATVSASQDAAKKEMKLLEGTWSMLSSQANGSPLPKEIVQTAKRTAKDGETTVMMMGKLYFKAKFKIDPSKKPKTIDYEMIEGPTKGKTQLGIYELDGDKVKFCFGAPGKDRPAEFTAEEGSGRTLSVWQREKK